MRTYLTAERARELYDYDYENGWLIRKLDRYGRPYNKPCGHKPNRSDGYSHVQIDGKKYKTHRIIWLWYYGDWPEHEIDHIDQNKMNNRIENLRDVSASQNSHNRGLQRNNTSGFPGVTWDKRAKKYHAQIMVNNKNINLGRYTTAEEAFESYKHAKIKYHPTSPAAQQYQQELGI